MIGVAHNIYFSSDDGGQIVGGLPRDNLSFLSSPIIIIAIIIIPKREFAKLDVLIYFAVVIMFAELFPLSDITQWQACCTHECVTRPQYGIYSLLQEIFP